MPTALYRDDESPVSGWVMTGLVVLVCTTIVGLAVAFLVPRRRPETAQGPAETAAPPPSPVWPVVQTPAKPVIQPPAEPPKPVAPPAAKPAVPPAGERSVEVPRPEPPPVAKQPSPPPVVATVEPPPAKPSEPPPANPPEPPAEKPRVAKPQVAAPTEKQVPDNPQRRTAFTKAVNGMRQAMINRDMAAARKFFKTAKTNVQSQSDQEQYDRLEIMLDNLEQFWEGIRTSVAKMQPPEELVISEDARVAVIEASRQQLVVMYGGRRAFRIEQIPRPLLEVIFTQNFQQTPGSMVIVGTFLTVENQPGDHEQAKKLWADAAKKGLDLGKQLLPELDAFGSAAAKPASPAPKRGRR
jgi:hypothetical protein